MSMQSKPDREPCVHGEGPDSLDAGFEDRSAIYPLFSGATLSSKLADIEAILGLIFTGFITLMVVVGVTVVLFHVMVYQRTPRSPWWWSVLGPAGLCVMLLQWKTLQQVGSSLESAAHPRPVEMALTQHAWSVPMRPIVAIWWWGQGAALLGAGDVMSSAYEFVNPGSIERVVEGALKMLVLFIASYASTVFLLFGMSALCPRRTLLTAIWRSRFFIDLGIAAVGYYIAGFVKWTS